MERQAVSQVEHDPEPTPVATTTEALDPSADPADPTLDAEGAEIEAEFELGALMRQAAVGLVALIGIVAGLAFLAHEPLQIGSTWFVDTLGLPGVFLGTLLVDTFMLTHEPFLLAAHVGGLPFWPTYFTASAASVLAGVSGWLMGGLFGRSETVQKLFERYHIRAFLKRYGVWAVGIAALTPFPFSAATWASGAAQVPLKVVVLGSLWRMPKVMFYFLLIVGGTALGDWFSVP